MSAGEGSFDDWCRSAALRFLQSVIVVDDLATLVTPPQVGRVTTPSEVDPADAENKVDDDTPTEKPELGLDAKTLVDEFSALGLVCGVMRPDPGEPQTELIVPAASRADIVLLDWRLHHDDGQKILGIIEKIAAVDGLRLIAVYTSAGELDDIAAQICENVKGSKHDEGSFRVTCGGLTVEVYAKEDAKVTEDEEPRRITTSALPDQLVSDFVEMTRGIVPSAAVATIGELRAATPRVLSLLGSRLDAGYLGHRILLADPDESGDHLLGLIGSEFMAAIEDNDLVKEAVGCDTVDLYIDQLVLGDGELSKDVLKRTLHIGTQSKSAKKELKAIQEVKDSDPPLLPEKAISQTFRFKAGDSAAAETADQEFAMKLSLRTATGVDPRLRLGTVVKDLNDGFLICLQPECDSVRLDQVRPFPFLPMRPPKGGQKQDLLIDDGGPVALRIVRNPFELRMVEFDPDPASRTVLARRESGEYVFKGGPSGTLAFVTQLRSGHAQDVAHQLAHQLSRVALDQSEVQRGVWQQGN